MFVSPVSKNYVFLDSNAVFTGKSKRFSNNNDNFLAYISRLGTDYLEHPNFSEGKKGLREMWTQEWIDTI